jgi:hypothetical protein
MARSAAQARERTVCETCELPYYADGEGCPYCARTTGVEAVTSEEPDEDSGFVFGSPDAGETTETGGDDGSDGLVGRLKRALGL